MKITNATFAGSSTRVSERPAARLPEFAFIGRSNVGKSSLINMLTGRKKLAMTSSTPGKTRLVNHFLINEEWYLVDLPGYGYAKMSGNGRTKLEQVIRNYLNSSEEMQLLLVLLDCRHDLVSTDMEFLDELGTGNIPFAIIFTKADKMGPEARQKQTERIKQQILEHWEELPPVFVSSSETSLGKEEILDYIGEILKQAKG